jgi:hypothetical protein
VGGKTITAQLTRPIDAKYCVVQTVVQEPGSLQTFHFRVLDDALWDTELPVSRASLGLPGTGNATFGLLDGREIVLPDLKPMFRRAWYFMARCCYQSAIRAGQRCAVGTNLSEQEWNQLRTDVANGSECVNSAWDVLGATSVSAT